MNATKMSQCKRIVAYILQFGSITTLEAVRDLGILRLASRIYDLVKDGIHVVKETVPVGNRYDEIVYVTRYTIEGEIPEAYLPEV